MKIKIKKIMGFLLMIMLVTMFNAFALTVNATIYKGTTNEGDWSFDSETGTLTISGEGNMQSSYGSSSPWKEYKESITSIVIEDGVKKIGGQAFSGCTSLTSVTVYGNLMWFTQMDNGNKY